MTRTTLACLPLVVAILTASACANPPPRPATTTESAAISPGVPGGTFTTRTEVSARVTFKDNANRRLTLLGGDGKQQVIDVPREAVNFDRINSGDLVVLTITEQVNVAVVDASTLVPQGEMGAVTLAEPGARPSGAIVGTTQIRGTVTAINHEFRTATMRTDDGRSLVVPVRPDIDLAKRQIGDQVVMRTTRRIEIRVESAAER